MTAYGSLRPTLANGFTSDEEDRLLAACPGVTVEPRVKSDNPPDPVWGAYGTMRYAWAGDPQVRFTSATGGVLTALGLHLVREKKAGFLLHVGADPEQPMRSRWVLSETPEQVIANCGSRYGPIAPLAGLHEALDRNEPFALIAKPCDAGALHRYSKLDSRVNELCVARLAMVCGGQSRLTKSSELLGEFGISESELRLFRYRGYGNPGRTRIETTDGRVFEKTYLELWEDETGWQLETRCKLCPDALGEAADIASADVWPGGSPSGEDAGYNGIIVHSVEGETLVESALAAGDLVLGDPIEAREFDGFQPHQVRKKEALWSRYQGLDSMGLPVIDTPGLRLKALSKRLAPGVSEMETEGTRKRVREGRISEPMPLTGAPTDG